MSQRRDDWVDIFRALGEAFFAVLRSEWDVLRQMWWQGTFRGVLHAAILFFTAACFFVMLVALGVTAAVLIVDIYLEPWQAALVVFAAVLLIILALLAIAYFVYLKPLQNPLETAKRRISDHLSWWRERLLQGELALPEGDDDGEK